MSYLLIKLYQKYPQEFIMLVQIIDDKIDNLDVKIFLLVKVS